MSERRVFHATEEGTVEAAPAPDENAGRERTADSMVFGTHVLSLNAAALMQLGLIDDPEAGTVEKDLEAAKHIIDTLIMLGEKTRGNLTADEERLLTTVVYELRLRFVEARG
jgi:hypothetical protein